MYLKVNILEVMHFHLTKYHLQTVVTRLNTKRTRSFEDLLYYTLFSIYLTVMTLNINIITYKHMLIVIFVFLYLCLIFICMKMLYEFMI